MMFKRLLCIITGHKMVHVGDILFCGEDRVEVFICEKCEHLVTKDKKQ